MKRLFSLLLLIALSAGPAWAFEAGAAKAEITPPLGTPLNGYGDRLGRGATAVHDPVWVRCLYVDDGTTKVFLLAADLCVINPELRARVLELAPAEVPHENIILTATHNHSGQGGMVKGLAFRSVSGRFMPEVLEATAKTFAQTMQAAYAARERATIGYGTTSQQVLSANRRQDGGPIDEQIGVLRVEDADGVPIALVANFAAHPTTVPDSDHYSISADYPGFYYSALEAMAGPKCVAMFMNGAEGNQRCANPENKDGWARTESIGRLLAQRVKGLANEIKCKEATLHMGYAAPALPRTLAKDILPDHAVLQTLEVDDLLLTFFPGEPCAEIGTALRQQALTRGYAAQFSVSLANDHLMYFVPRTTYGTLDYECAANFYGPHIEDWFYAEFGKLMTRGESAPAPVVPDTAAVEELDGGQRLTLTGSPYAIGFQRGAAYAEVIAKAYHDNVVVKVDAREWIPDSGLWAWAPSFINLTPIALPALGIGARPLLKGMPDEVFEEIAGMADGALLPFDAVWLAQCAPTYAAHAEVQSLYRMPFCTMFAVMGDKAGADDILVGRNLDWAEHNDRPVLLEVHPDTGHYFIELSFPWSAGAFSGMNDAGVVLCAERAAPLGEPSLDGPPVELLLRQLLQSADSAKAALAVLQAAGYLHGYRILAADARSSDARVVEFGPTLSVRAAQAGVLLGADPASQLVDADARIRYTRAADLLTRERILSVAEIKKILADADSAQVGQARILNEDTCHSVVFEPKTLRVHAAFRGQPGVLGKYTTLTVGKRTHP